MYYPKSKIVTNQYTAGNELVYLNTDIPYQGSYYMLANGQIFSGKNPNDGVPRELQAVSVRSKNRPGTLNSEQSTNLTVEELHQMELLNTEYDQIRKKTTPGTSYKSLIEPEYSFPAVAYPSFIRYFAKRTNGNVYVEISKDTYTRLLNKDKEYNWPAYIIFSIPWTTGQKSKSEIAEINKKIVYSTERTQKLYGFSQYITNYTQFAISY